MQAMKPSRSYHNGHTTWQWEKADAINPSISPHETQSSEIDWCTEKSLLLIQKVLWITNQVSGASLLLKHLIPGVHDHNK